PPDTEPPFFPILFSAPEVYEQIYIIAYERFDRKWQNMNALYMQFSQVIHILVQSMEEVIAKKPKSIKELERLLDNSSMLNSQTNIPLAEMISPGSPTSPRTNSGTLIRSPSDLRNPAEYVNVASPGTTGSVSPSVSPTPESSSEFSAEFHRLIVVDPVSPPPTLVRSPSHEKTSAPPDKAPPPVPAGPKPTRPPPRPPRTDLQASPSAPASPHTFTPASPQEESSEAVEPKIGFRPARRTGSGFTSALNLALSNGPKEDVPSRSHTLSNSQSTPDLRTSDLHKSRTLPTNATLSPPADMTSPMSRKNTPNIGGNSSSKYLIPVPVASPNETEEEKNQRMRSTVIYEIMSTEIDYVNDLNILKNVFKLPLEIQVCKVGGLRTEEINVLFSNAETLLKCNEQLVADWQEAVEAGERDIDIIVDIFEKMSQFFKMYTFYCANQPQSIAKFEELKKNPTFISTLKCRNLSLKDFLIKPVQRICKYPLFFTQMIRYTSESEPAFKRLRDCQKKIEETAAYINDFRVKDEKIQRVVEIQDNFDPPLTFELVTNNRRFIKEATIRGKVYNQETTELNLFIFNDLLLITRKKAKGAYQFKLKIALESLRYVELADTENSKNAFTLEHSEVKSDSITIFAENNAEKSEWRKDIKSMVNDYNKKKINEMAKAKSKNLNSP
ncbi:calmodulin-binding protein, partial [Planoprotostelium fungivorum]